MRLFPRVALVATTAAIAFPLSLWLAESFHIDCRRGTGERFDCVVESSKRGSTRVYKIDHTMLRSAKLDIVQTVHTDGTVDERHYLKLVLLKGAISTQDGDAKDIRQRAQQINAFINSPEQTSMRFTLSNQNYRLWLAALLVLAAAVLTHDFRYKPKRATQYIVSLKPRQMKLMDFFVRQGAQPQPY